MFRRSDPFPTPKFWSGASSGGSKVDPPEEKAPKLTPAAADPRTLEPGAAEVGQQLTACLKLADKTCNVLDVIQSQPVGWSLERRIDYLDWTEKSAVGCRGVNAALEEHYDRVLRRGRETLETAT